MMEQKNLRPPVVVVVGHVDHGKTSLLDAIRNQSSLVAKHQSVAEREAGGITQSIGASVANNITFIDTPGHALFGRMRSRGVNLADIAILVVAADDGVQPQTREAIKLLQESGLPFVTAITKIDLNTANIDSVLQQLEKEGVYFEKRGGSVPYIGVSSKSGEGIKELLDLISLISEVSGLKGNASSALEAFVIETSRDKGGLLVSIVLKSGKIKVGDTIYASQNKAKVKGIFNGDLKSVKEIDAGYPAQILGFEELPKVGSSVTSQPVNTEIKIEQKAKENKESKLTIFVKAKTAGSLEALLANIPEEVHVTGSGVGDVTDSDIFFAKASDSKIFLFESKFSAQVRKLSETEGVKIERFDVIYDLIEKLKDLIKSDEVETLGKASVVAIFPFNDKKIAGCKIMQGKISKTGDTRLMRGEREIAKVKIISIKKQKEEVQEVKQGEECGILFVPNVDFEAGDVLLSLHSI